jgi:hypothetical protein
MFADIGSNIAVLLLSRFTRPAPAGSGRLSPVLSFQPGGQEGIGDGYLSVADKVPIPMPTPPT